MVFSIILLLTFTPMIVFPEELFFFNLLKPLWCPTIFNVHQGYFFPRISVFVGHTRECAEMCVYIHKKTSET